MIELPEVKEDLKKLCLTNTCNRVGLMLDIIRSYANDSWENFSDQTMVFITKIVQKLERKKSIEEAREVMERELSQ